MLKFWNNKINVLIRITWWKIWDVKRNISAKKYYKWTQKKYSDEEHNSHNNWSGLQSVLEGVMQQICAGKRKKNLVLLWKPVVPDTVVSNSNNKASYTFHFNAFSLHREADIVVILYNKSHDWIFHLWYGVLKAGK